MLRSSMEKEPHLRISQALLHIQGVGEGLIKLGYVRTSKAEQHPENQAARIHNEGVPGELIFIDQGISGSTMERPALTRLRAFIKDHGQEGGLIYVFEISRLGRSFLDTLAIVNELEAGGFMVWSLSHQESWTRTENKKLRELMLAIFTWVSDQERANLIERTKAGQARAKAEGKNIGRPFREIPWKKVDELKGKKLTLSAVSRLLDIPYSTLLKRNKERQAD